MEAQTIEKKGKSVDEAIKAALEELGCEIDDVSIEVIAEPTRGLLGIVGRKPAVVRVSLRERPEEDVRRILVDILNFMKIDYKIDKVELDERKVRINIVGKDMGLLIGRKGETLNSVQTILGLIVNKRRDERIRVILDVEESLGALALKLSDKVKNTKKSIVMRPMSSQERRIVHTVLQGDPMVTTYSTGNEPNRKVVISLKK